MLGWAFMDGPTRPALTGLIPHRSGIQHQACAATTGNAGRDPFTTLALGVIQAVVAVFRFAFKDPAHTSAAHAHATGKFQIDPGPRSCLDQAFPVLHLDLTTTASQLQ